MKKKYRIFVVVVVILLVLLSIWGIARVIIHSSYSSSSYIENKELEKLEGKITPSPDENEETSEYKIPTVYIETTTVEDFSESSDLYGVFDKCKKSLEKNGTNFSSYARVLKEKSSVKANTPEYKLDDEGYKLPIRGVKGNIFYSGTTIDVLVQMSYDMLRREELFGENISKYGCSFGYYKGCDILYLCDSDSGEEWYIIGNMAGYPKMYCKSCNFTDSEQEYFESLGLFFLKDEGLNIFYSK